MREQGKALALKGCKVVARLNINDAQGAEWHPLPVQQGRPGIEADMRRASHQGICHEARIGTGVRHDEDRAILHGMRAEGEVPWRFFRIQPRASQEALAFVLDNADQSDRRFAKRGGEVGYLVQRAKTADIQIIARQDGRAIRLQPPAVSHR